MSARVVVCDRQHTIYGLRLRGETEARYIGMTNGLPELRLRGHFNAAALGRNNPEFAEWLSANENEIETFKIAYADNRDHARGIEKVVIAICGRLGQRLFNLPTGPKPKAAA